MHFKAKYLRESYDHGAIIIAQFCDMMQNLQKFSSLKLCVILSSQLPQHCIHRHKA